jgi:3-oxoadipate enol-lactonase/4-carboxymuconolactone decarboxylase
VNSEGTNDAAGGARLGHRLDGPSGAPPLILGPSLGTSMVVWEPLLARLTTDRRVLRYDLPGHGGPPTGPTVATVAALARHVLDLADLYGFATFDYAGISLGAAIGTQLALHAPARVRTLTLICSSARFSTPEHWHDRAALVRGQGTRPLIDVTEKRWFADPATANTPLGRALLTDLAEADPAGYAACCDALAAFDVRADLGRITAPTLVIAGRQDPATPPEQSRELADGIHDATLLELPGAAHLAPVERPGRVADALLAHLGQAPGDEPGSDTRRRAEGFAVRRAVLGDAHVDRALAQTTDFTADFQDFITRYAWGEIWTRPGLDRRLRSVVTLTALVAGGHDRELPLHVRGAVSNGLTREQIKEILLQTAVYCGAPAANTAFAVAQRTLDELDAARASDTGHHATGASDHGSP